MEEKVKASNNRTLTLKPEYIDRFNGTAIENAGTLNMEAGYAYFGGYSSKYSDTIYSNNLGSFINNLDGAELNMVRGTYYVKNPDSPGTATLINTNGNNTVNRDSYGT